MRWFTDEAYAGDHGDWEAALVGYDAHVRRIVDQLPIDLARLASDPRLNLHDGRIRSIIVDQEASTVEMNLTTGADSSQGYGHIDLRLVFGGARFVPENLQAIAYAIGATFETDHWGTARTAVLAQEIDIADAGRYVLRLRLWPFHQFGLVFDSLSLSEGPAAPDEGGVGKFLFTGEGATIES
jgi:hypothetical protein